MDEIVVTSQRHNNQSRTLIRIGDASDDFPSHLLTGEKEVGYTYIDSKISQWEWINVIDIEQNRYIVSHEIDLLPFRAITTTLRSDALRLIRELADFCLKLSEEFLDPYNGFIETWRIFFIKSGGFLILPDQLSQIILYCSDSQRRNECYYHYLKPNTFFPFALSFQFTQFLYLAAAKENPYSPSSVRCDKWRHIPLSLGFTTLDKKTAAWIDKTLFLSFKEQQKLVSSAYSAQENLKWFLQESENLKWQFESDELVETFNYKTYKSNLDKRVTRKKFLQEKTPLFISIIITIALAISILVGVKSKPNYSYTDSVTLIEDFYHALNEFDLKKAATTMKQFAKNPYEKEVGTLYVAHQMRSAYNSEENPLEGTLWQTRDLNITQISDESFKVDYIKTLIIQEDESTTVVNELSEEALIKLKKRNNSTVIDEIEILKSTLIDSYKLEL